MATLESLQGGPERELYKAMRVTHILQWRPQDVKNHGVYTKENYMYRMELAQGGGYVCCAG